MRAEYIFQEFNKLLLSEQVDILFKALDLIKQDARQSKSTCIGLAMGIPKDPQILRIEDIKDYDITVLFDNQEERVIHFSKVFNPDKKIQKELLANHEKFKKVTIAEGTLAWKELGFWTKDLEGKTVFDYFDVDPGLLYEHSSPIVAV